MLRDRVEKCGLYRISIAFYMAIFLHILFLDFLGWWTMKTFGTGWLSYIAASVFLATAQVIFIPSLCLFSHSIVQFVLHRFQSKIKNTGAVQKVNKMAKV